MRWKERFQKSRQLVDNSKRVQKEKKKQLQKDRKAIADLLKARKKAVRSLTPNIEKVLRQYNRAVKGEMVKLRAKDWNLGNAGWILSMQFGGIKTELWPWITDKEKPRLLRGLWLQYLGPNGKTLLAEPKVRGTKLRRSFELGTEGAYWKGYYYWIEGDTVTRPHCTFGYFLPIADFDENTLATLLEEIGYEIPKLKNYFL